MSGGVLKKLSIESCHHIDVPSLPIFTVNNWIVSHKNSGASKIDFTFYLIEQDRILQSRPAKNSWSLNGLPFVTYLTLQTWLLLTIIFFDLSLITYMRKNSVAKVTSKRTWRTLSAKKSPDFYEHGIFSLPGSWQQVVHSDGGYVFEN